MASSIKALVAGLLGSNGDGIQAEQGLFHRIWDRVKQVYRQLRGGRVDKTERPQPAHRDRYVNQKLEKGDTDRLVERLFSGEINHQQWTLEARQEIKKSFIAQYVYAHGGPQSMTQADWGRIGAMVKPQYAFLRNFEQDLIDGKLSEAQAKARLRMYTKASRQAFEQGRAYAQGLPRLPAYPGDGSTQCLSNCACHWDIDEQPTEWLAVWTLGAAEHCPDCLQRADDWAPYRVQKAMI